jgi:hypothetical protein
MCSLPVEFHEARDLINQVISTEEGVKLPAAFPKEYYSFFNRIGRSLENGERLEWSPQDPNPTALTPARRKALVLAAGQTYEAEVDVVGRVFDLNTEKNEGQLRTGENDKIAFEYGEPFFNELWQALGKNRTLFAHIEGIGVFDVNDRLKSIKEISQLEVVRHYALISLIDGLSGLANGWLEGGGIAPTGDNLNGLTNEVATWFPETLEYPSVAPTEDGNVVFEWIRPHARIELEVNFPDQLLELYASNLKSGDFVEESFPNDQWDEAFTRISTLLQS